MNRRILIYLVMTVTWFMFTASTCFVILPDMVTPTRFVVWNNTSDTLVWIECVYPEKLSDISYEEISHIFPYNSHEDYMIPPNRCETRCYNDRDGKESDLRKYYFSLLPYGYSTEIFISLDTIKKYGWEDVVKNNRVYQRYDLCYDDVAPIQAATVGYMDNPDWELWFSVPPTDCMKDVKMWPPYGHYKVISQ